MQRCECGHYKEGWVHKDDGPCTVGGCDCPRFQPAEQGEVVAVDAPPSPTTTAAEQVREYSEAFNRYYAKPAEPPAGVADVARLHGYEPGPSLVGDSTNAQPPVEDDHVTITIARSVFDWFLDGTWYEARLTDMHDQLLHISDRCRAVLRAQPPVECDWKPVITGPDEDGERELELRLSPTKQLFVRVTPDGLREPIVRHDDTGTYEHFAVLRADVVARMRTTLEMAEDRLVDAGRTGASRRCSEARALLPKEGQA